jgi:elongation factor P hydroxylase
MSEVIAKSIRELIPALTPELTSKLIAKNNVETAFEHRYQDLINIFKRTFYQDYNTLLVAGCDEPLYSPASELCNYHQIIFAHGYYASALHEIAHWCVAGEQRRLLEDFGYWYEPDGRDEQQQKAFEQVEIKPQAIEWGFCIAAQMFFNVSADNLNGIESDATAFKKSVRGQVRHYLESGFPARAQKFINALADFYQTSIPLTIDQFTSK